MTKTAQRRSSDALPQILTDEQKYGVHLKDKIIDFPPEATCAGLSSDSPLPRVSETAENRNTGVGSGGKTTVTEST